jgi:alkyl sulfatase BDS1-like metallo-beta-lactamase superfamily hydrolase
LKYAPTLSLGLLLAACHSGIEPPPEAAGSPAALSAHSQEFRREVIEVAKGIHVAVGYGISNSILIEGEDGLIVVDAMESLETAEAVAAEFRKISDKPVKALIYTHSHPDHIAGGPAFLKPGQAPPAVYAQAGVLANIDKIASELQPIIARRAFRMYGNYLSEAEMVNVGIGPRLGVGQDSQMQVLRPTRSFVEQLDDRVAGVHFQLLHAPGETEDQLFVWLPERRILLSGDNFYRAFPNLYTIRGTSYRDPKAWAASLDRMRALAPEALVPSHGRPLLGADLVRDSLRDYRDAIRFVYDQSIRLFNQGLGPDEIAGRLRLPEHLASSPYLQEFYGRPDWSARSVFSGNLGWFDGNPSRLRPLPPTEEAKRWAELTGGTEALVDAVVKASQNGEHQWVLQLSDQALQLAPDNRELKAARVAALRALGEAESNPNARHWYLVSMHELTGDLVLPEHAMKPTPAMLATMPLSLFFDGMAVNLDAEASADRRIQVGFEFSDEPERYTYIVRNGVSEVLSGLEPDLDIRVRVSAQVFKETLAQIRNPALSVVRDFKVVQGSKLEFIRFMQLFKPDLQVDPTRRD